MKRYSVLFLSIFMLSACATFQRPKVVWPGQNFDNYIAANGVPTSQYTLQNGNTAFSFKKACYYDSAKTGETLVIVGQDNIIVSVSTPTKCPSYYDSNDYKIDQIYQQQQNEYYEEQQRRFKAQQRKDKIEELRNDISGVEMEMDLKKTRVDIAEINVDYYTIKRDAEGLAKAKEELKEAQNTMTELNTRKAEYERELERLKSRP